jgi:hypothetical protein
LSDAEDYATDEIESPPWDEIESPPWDETGGLSDLEAEPGLVEELNKRFLQATSYLIEWAKHIITIGSALMLLSVALLKDIVRDAGPPLSYIIAGLLVLSYLSMLGAIWQALRFVRSAASYILTAAPRIGTPEKLDSLRARLKRVQVLFLLSLSLFAVLALCSLLTWALGSGAQPRAEPKGEGVRASLTRAGASLC